MIDTNDYKCCTLLMNIEVNEEYLQVMREYYTKIVRNRVTLSETDVSVKAFLKYIVCI